MAPGTKTTLSPGLKTVALTIFSFLIGFSCFATSLAGEKPG